jgi:putative membrane protein
MEEFEMRMQRTASTAVAIACALAMGACRSNRSGATDTMASRMGDTMTSASRMRDTMTAAGRDTMTTAGRDTMAAGRSRDTMTAAGRSRDTMTSAGEVRPDSSGMATGTRISAPNALATIGVSNAGEIETSRIAQTKAQNSDVKSFARDMIKDHTAMQADADKLAIQLNLTPQANDQAAQMRNMIEQMRQSLARMSPGMAFDTAYINGQVVAHQKTLDQLQTISTSVDVPDVKSLVNKATPTVREHLDRARKLQSQLSSNPR